VTAPAWVRVGSGADLTCSSFASQEDAQAVLDAGAGDRFRLDPDGDGIACNQSSTETGETGASTPGPTATPTATAAFGDPIAADVDRFWRRTFKRVDLRYISPTDLVAADAQTSTPCGIFGFSPAYYRPPDGGIYYDDATFAERNDDGYGYAYWILMLAHEWGHHAQDLLGDLDAYHGAADPTVFSISIELQAQCAAGAYVRDALRRDVLAQIEADQVDLLAHTALSDRAHGPSSLQVDTYERGRAKGLGVCGFEY